MVTVTERAATELQEVLKSQHASDSQGVKLVPGVDGRVQMTIAEPSAGDQVTARFLFGEFFDFYFSDTEGPAAQQFIAESIAVAEQVQQEDVAICEDVQRGLASGAFDTGRFSVKREVAGYHFHQLLARYLQKAGST